MIHISYLLAYVRNYFRNNSMCLVILITIFSGNVSTALATPLKFEKDILQIQLQSGKHITYHIEIAKTNAQRQQGLKFRTFLGSNEGMLFIFPKVELIHMWMQDTLIPLDMLFIDAQGTIVSITENTTPLSAEIISSQYPVTAVLELKGGTVQNEGIIIGDMVLHSRLGNR